MGKPSAWGSEEAEWAFNKETFLLLREKIMMSTKLLNIAKKAKQNPKMEFTSIAHLLTPEFLLETWKQMNKKACAGVDKETVKQFSLGLTERLKDVSNRILTGKYRAPMVRRVEIPKVDGKTRPLGIPTVEDRLVQRAVARILEAIYEQDFLECSYGYRPNRNPHMALKGLATSICKGKVSFVYETDIKGYFNTINHQWLRKMVKHRIKDPLINRLISKWLKAGVMDKGVVARPEAGTPQGGPISPILANLYLHYVLDLWFEKRLKGQLKGEAFLHRFVDDFVICIQYECDLNKIVQAVPIRLKEFALTLAENKTRKLSFGKYARERAKMFSQKLEEFEFLGFRHICGISAKTGGFALIRIPAQKSCRKFIDNTKAWLRKHIHWKRRDQQKHLTIMLNGFYQYFGLKHCENKLNWVYNEVKHQWIRVLKMQSQRHRIYWSYLMKSRWFWLPQAKVIHPNI
ncbi:MAG: group II intron reverse transcriptase/maturase [Pseudobdellovibrionaceae bacterium]